MMLPYRLRLRFCVVRELDFPGIRCRLFSFIKAFIGSHKQVFWLGLMEVDVPHGGSNAGFHADRIASDIEFNFGKTRQQSFDGDLNFSGSTSKAQGHEFVSTKSSDNVIRTHGKLQLSPNAGKHLVTDNMAICVVNQFEIVQVDYNNTDGIMCTL